MKATLTAVTRYTTKKDGSPLVSAKGIPYTSLRIKTQEHGDKFLSGFENAGTKTWKVGDEVEIEVEQKGDYLNFTTPKPAQANNVAVQRLAEQIQATNTNVLRVVTLIQDLARELKNAGIIGETNSDGSKVPDFTVPYPKDFSGITNSTAGQSIVHTTAPTLPPTEEYEEEVNAKDIPW